MVYQASLLKRLPSIIEDINGLVGPQGVLIRSSKRTWLLQGRNHVEATTGAKDHTEVLKR